MHADVKWKEYKSVLTKNSLINRPTHNTPADRWTGKLAIGYWLRTIAVTNVFVCSTNMASIFSKLDDPLHIICDPLKAIEWYAIGGLTINYISCGALQTPLHDFSPEACSVNASNNMYGLAQDWLGFNCILYYYYDHRSIFKNTGCVFAYTDDQSSSHHAAAPHSGSS
jgi:hypothetical protein